MTSGSFSSGVLRSYQESSLGLHASLWTAVAEQLAATAPRAAAARRALTHPPPGRRELSFGVCKQVFHTGASLSSHLFPSPLPLLFHSLICAGSTFWNIAGYLF